MKFGLAGEEADEEADEAADEDGRQEEQVTEEDAACTNDGTNEQPSSPVSKSSKRKLDNEGDSVDGLKRPRAPPVDTAEVANQAC